MSKLLKMFGMAALFGALMMAGGCGGGGDDAPPPVTDPTATTSFTATPNTNGSATTGATTTNVATAPGTTGYLATVSAAIPPSTTITAKNADGTTKVLTAAPSITFTAPADSTAAGSGVHSVPVQPGLTLVATSAAIRVEMTGAASATFSNPITITMPVPGEPAGEVIEVYTAKEGSTTFTLLGSFTVAPAGFVSFPVSSFSWFTSGRLTVDKAPAETAVVGQRYSFTPIVKAQSGNDWVILTGLNFSINKTPPNWGFNGGVGGSGELFGTPTTVGETTNGIVISFTGYRHGTKTLPPFNIRVIATGGGGGT